MTPTFWEYTKMSAQRATREYFAPLIPSPRPAGKSYSRSSSPPDAPASSNVVQASADVVPGAIQNVELGDMFDKIREYFEKGKALVDAEAKSDYRVIQSASRVAENVKQTSAKGGPGSHMWGERLEKR